MSLILKLENERIKHPGDGKVHLHTISYPETSPKHTHVTVPATMANLIPKIEGGKPVIHTYPIL